MAMLNDRQWVGIDVSKEYIEISRKRMSAARAGLRTVQDVSASRRERK